MGFSTGRKRDKTYTSTHGGAGTSTNVAQLKAMERGPVSIQERRHAPSIAEVRRCLENAQCPICGKSFRNVAAHTNRTHGIPRNELKDMAGIPHTQSVCSPELRQKCSDRGKRAFAENPERRQTLRPKGNRRTYSPGGLAVQREKAQAGRAKMGARDGGLPPKLLEHNRELYLARTAERDRQIADMARAGAALSEIMQHHNVIASTVRRALARHNVAANFRAARIRPPAEIEKFVARTARSRTREATQLAEQRLARWRQLGKTFQATKTLAAEWGVDPRHVRAYLITHGETVPDGRRPKGQP